MAGLLGISSKRLSSWKHVTGLFKCLQHEQRAVQSFNYSVMLTSVGIQDQHKLYRDIQLRQIHLSRSLADDHGSVGIASSRSAKTEAGSMAEEMTKRADELALKVLKLEEKNYADPAEQEERRKRDCNIVVFGIPEFESEDLDKRREHDILAVKNYFRFLGFENVNIVNVERLDVKEDQPRITIALESPDIQKRILLQNTNSKRQRKVYKLPDGTSRVGMSHDRTPLQDEMRACLREELELRKQVSEMKYEPLWWHTGPSKVSCKLPQREFNTHGLSVHADELSARAQRFQAMEVDEEEIKRRESLAYKIRIFNKLHKLENHTKILDCLLISDDQVKSVKQLPMRNSQSFWLELELDSPETVNKAMARKSELQNAPEEWVRMSRVFRVLTCLEKYIDELLKDEIKIRNTIANIERQPIDWSNRDGRVKKRDW